MWVFLGTQGLHGGRGVRAEETTSPGFPRGLSPAEGRSQNKLVSRSLLPIGWRSGGVPDQTKGAELGPWAGGSGHLQNRPGRRWGVGGQPPPMKVTGRAPWARCSSDPGRCSDPEGVPLGEEMCQQQVSGCVLSVPTAQRAGAGVWEGSCACTTEDRVPLGSMRPLGGSDRCSAAAAAEEGRAPLSLTPGLPTVPGSPHCMLGGVVLTASSLIWCPSTSCLSVLVWEQVQTFLLATGPSRS